MFALDWLRNEEVLCLLQIILPGEGLRKAKAEAVVNGGKKASSYAWPGFKY